MSCGLIKEHKATGVGLAFHALLLGGYMTLLASPPVARTGGAAGWEGGGGVACAGLDSI